MFLLFLSKLRYYRIVHKLRPYIKFSKILSAFTVREIVPQKIAKNAVENEQSRITVKSYYNPIVIDSQ